MLDVRGLTKSYRTRAGSLTVLRDVSFTVERSTLAAVIGPSGSGKTTLLNVIATIDRADAGQIWLDATPLHCLVEPELEIVRRRDVGIVFQDFGLLPALTAAENVEMALLMEDASRRSRRARALEALDAVGLADHANRFPHELSGGQKQRVGIARALVKKPRLVLADEPTANLDSQNALALLTLMQRLTREAGIAFLVATHDSRLLEAADRRFTLCDGRLTP
ncbi:MAG: ABC transporter ATP-binding protein [Pseudomonadota bacterium]|jgi:ABC-type antimicrobial peptide transport system, ATPase component|nr:MAG: hypothetical protein DIU56_14770 [Pseudomonadota bacterium]